MEEESDFARNVRLQKVLFGVFVVFMKNTKTHKSKVFMIKMFYSNFTGRKKSLIDFEEIYSLQNLNYRLIFQF